MSEYVGLKQGKVHDRREISEYYCGGCGYPVTDHDSYCRECGGALHESYGQVPEQDKRDDDGERESYSRWFQLFGTPERAARTLKKLIEDGPFLIKEDRDSFKPAKVCDLLDELCGGCGKCPSCVNAHETEYSIKFECNGGDYDALLEWLRGDAE